MKRLNRKITLLAFTLLLSSGQAMANESGLSIDSSVSKYSYFAETTGSQREAPDNMVLAENKNEQKGDNKNEQKGDNEPWWDSKCKLPNGKEGKFCKDTKKCVKTQKECSVPSAS